MVVAENTPCWFCGKALGGKWNRHHLVPARYLSKDARKDERNIVPVHIKCHERFNRQHDSPAAAVPMTEFVFRMHELNFGRDLYAEERVA